MTTDPSRPLRVLVVARWYPAYDDRAAGIFVADHCDALTAAGVEVRVASWEAAPLIGGDDETAARLGARWAAETERRPPVAVPVHWGAAGVPVARLRAVTRPRIGDAIDEAGRVRSQAATLVAYGRTLARSWSFDLIQAHTGLPDGAAAAVLATELGLPLVTLEHDSTVAGRLAGADARRLYEGLFGPDRVVLAVGAGLAHRLTATLGRERGAIGVVPNPVALDAFALGPRSARDPNELLWVGRRRASKGMPALLEAFAIVRGRRPELRLRLIGPATAADDEEWRRRAAALGIDDAIAFEPPADRPGVAAAMQRAGVFVHPSPFETFGLVAAEALATGLPVAATPSGGVDDILGRDGRLGEVAAGTDGPALAVAIDQLLARLDELDPADLRRSIEARYAPAIVAGQMLERYQALVERSPAPGGESSRWPAGRPASPARVAATTPLPVVVAFRRTHLERRLVGLPPGLIERLRIVTAARPDAPSEGEPDHRTWIVVDDQRAIRDELDPLAHPPRAGTSARIVWLARHPLAAVRRRWIGRRRPAVQLAARQVALRAFADAELADPQARLMIVALDGDDLLAAESVLGDRVELAAGGLRWLADASDEATAGDEAIAGG